MKKSDLYSKGVCKKISDLLVHISRANGQKSQLTLNPDYYLDEGLEEIP